MASNVTAESVLEKISEDHLKCTICISRYRQPKVLDCLHSFCLKCLLQLSQHQYCSGTRLMCPICRHKTILKGSGVADLPNNFTLTAMVADVTLHEKQQEGQESEIKCQACDEENQAISRCMDCDHFLCRECQKAHGRMTLMKSHKIFTLVQLQSGEIVFGSKLREEVPKCGKHPDQNLSIYCNTCEQVICTTCSNQDHETHSHISISIALGKCKKNIAELISKVEKSTTQLNIVVRKTEKLRKKLDTMFADTQQKIIKRADEEVAKIREEEQKLLKDTERIYEDRVKTCENAHATNSKEVTQAEHKLEEVKQLMAQASCHEILELQQKLLHNLSELIGKQPEKVSDTLFFLDFQEGERSLGRIVLEEEPKTAPKQSPRPGILCLEGKWELKTNIKLAKVKEVAALSGNKIHAVVSISTRNELFTVSLPKSKHEAAPIPQRLITGLTLTGIGLSKDDRLIALDGPAVKFFNKQHQLHHQFTPAKESNTRPTCLAVDDINLIALGYKDEKAIYLHNPDGSLIRRLPAPMIGDYLTICKQRLVYTSYSEQWLLSVDYHGAKVFSVDMINDMQESGNPTGVCCDSDGSIYVAVNRHSTSDILHYGPDGKYIRRVISKVGDAYGIALTSGGDLAVAAGDSVKIYHRA